MKQRLKLKVQGHGVHQETFIQGQIKLGVFWETVITVMISGGRDADEAIRIAKQKLQAYTTAGFDDKGVIDL